MVDRTIAVVDTDVFSAVFIDPEGASRRGLPVARWRSTLTGVRVLVAFQTRGEVLAGLRGGNWGKRRVSQAVETVNRTPTVAADRQVIDSYAELTAECRRVGHPLHQKIHAGDRWVAACAVAKDLPLLSGDSIYRDAPGLRLFGEADD